MKLKLNNDGSAVVRNGMPVYVHANGREEAFDAPTAWKLALGAHFQHSPVMAGLKIPHDLAAAAFSDAFRIEGGKLVAVDKHGITMYSPTRHGQAADFNEAFTQLVNAYPSKAMIQREGDAPTAPGAGGDGARRGTPPNRGANVVTRAQFEQMPHIERPGFFKAGGKVEG